MDLKIIACERRRICFFVPAKVSRLLLQLVSKI
jgi:hypothetical protein